MALEIERKFLVNPDADFRSLAVREQLLEQGYLSDDPDRTVRVRVAGNHAFITVKSRNVGAVRHEWEYAIPVDDARRMIALPGTEPLSKMRYLIEWRGREWEVDVFHGALAGLVTAEVELDSADEPVVLPPFVGREVTHDKRFYNSNLRHLSADGLKSLLSSIC